ncbi:hypothetical protein L6452_28556 [Arctium lappa]|uniref:Uncharacterized protein n=1 Tax=Arctium lappa TaxID=4217 RepID=A0ACB8ZZM0_ARCLA|nr:hypothetical protein L6452_28556 [Arctium lappa]
MFSTMQGFRNYVQPRKNKHKFDPLSYLLSITSYRLFDSWSLECIIIIGECARLSVSLKLRRCSETLNIDTEVFAISSVQMGVCNWFKRKKGNKRKKENSPVKLEHIQQDSVDSKGGKDTYSTGNKSVFLASSREVNVRNMGTKEFAATRIQTAFRAYKARKTLRYLKGISRFQASIDMGALTKQTSNALERLHFWSKIQAEIGARRLSATEGRIKQMKLDDRLKVESKLHELEMDWCVGPEMEETVSKLQQRAEAAHKRERALAYAFSHQWRANSNRYFGQAYYDLSKESWGWKWIERWIAVCRCEAHVVVRPVVSPRAGLKPKPTKMLVAMGMEKVQQKQAIVLPQQRG